MLSKYLFRAKYNVKLSSQVFKCATQNAILYKIFPIQKTTYGQLQLLHTWTKTRDHKNLSTHGKHPKGVLKCRCNSTIDGPSSLVSSESGMCRGTPTYFIDNKYY